MKPELHESRDWLLHRGDCSNVVQLRENASAHDLDHRFGHGGRSASTHAPTLERGASTLNQHPELAGSMTRPRELLTPP